MDFFLTILVSFSLAIFLGKAAKALGVPRAVGYLFAGILLANPLVRPLLFDSGITGSFESLASIGVLLLFFFAGLKISFSQFSRNLKESLSISILNTVLPSLAVLAFGLAIGLPWQTALILGLILSVSAQAIIVDILDELGLLKERLGVLIVNAGSVDDIVELIFMGMVLALVGVGGVGDLPGLVINLGLFAAVLLAVKLVVIPTFFRFFGAGNSEESLFGASLLVALLMAVLSNLLGLGALIGALIAGILVRHFLSIESRKPWEEHRISGDIHLIGFGFLVPLFFVWVGFNTDLQLAASEPFMVTMLFLLSFVLGAAGTYLGVRLNKGSRYEGFIVALGLSTKGDAELAVSLVALQAGFISQQLFSIIVIIALISSVLPPIIFRHFIRDYPKKPHVKAAATL